ncbi:MAG: ribonuclease Y [Armatimonadetes bacterium]|nr:ribonuclease Y [Armatimonadota bacterium]CUU35303.1 metal dependent phosphohydrolase [Armatimonadetes bacterium DC]
METIVGIVGVILVALLAAGAGYMLAARQVRAKHAQLLQEAEQKRKEAEYQLQCAQQERAQIERERENLTREALLQAREEAHRILEAAEQEAREKRAEVLRLEQRLLQREELLEHRFEMMEQREHALMEREALLTKKQGELRELMAQRRIELERISGMTTEQARELLLKEIRDEIEHEAAILARQIEEEARRDAERRAREIILDTVQRCVVDHVAQNTITVLHLPSEEMKGRIIGREGRNIRHFEHITGVDVIIDDTPEAVVLSSFDPIRREIARITMLNLIHDGRIQPARIEEEYERAKNEVERRIWQAGEEAVLQVGLTGMHPEIVRTLGKLRYRTSYAQNVLDHSIEVAMLAGLLAAELKLDTRLVKRAALLHDIGKALENATEGPHAIVGMEFLRRFGENELVCNAVGAHHYDIEPASLEAHVVIIADSISAARPGARRESLQQYLRRMQDLERIAMSFEGVEKVYAIQAGREVRVLVKPNEVDDWRAHQLAREIAHKIQAELEYPGQVKVTVIREVRAHHIAH